MATITANYPTLVDVAKRLDPDGKIAQIAEMLTQTNEILSDIPFLEGNLPTGHRTTVRTGLPAVAWRLLNGGVTSSKSTTAQIDEQTGMLEAYSEVDVELARLNGNEAAFRLSEAQAFLEAMNQEMAQTLFYGNSGVSPEEFTGLSVRYSSSTAGNGQNVLRAGGAGSDNTSIWLIVWGQNTVHGLYPKGSRAGLSHKDLGEVTIENANGIGGARMQAYRDHWQWKCGIALRDWRYAVRICNIDVSNLVAESSAADLIKWMIKAIHRIPSFGMGRAAFYCNRTVYQMLDIQAQNKAVNTLTTGNDAAGRPMTAFRGIPIRKVDQILENEALVS
jgi:hypothetical protein